MFKFFKNLFSSQKSQAVEPPAVVADSAPADALRQKKPAKQVPVAFNSQLIDNCKSEHQALLGVYTDMMTAAESGNLEQTKAKHQQLSNGLKEHFAKEFKDLYVYLDYRTRMDDDKSEFDRVREFRVELQRIGVQITTIVNRYESRLNADSMGDFISDYKKLGEALVDRIQREETILYPLYNRYGMEAAA